MERIFDAKIEKNTKKKNAPQRSFCHVAAAKSTSQALVVVRSRRVASHGGHTSEKSLQETMGKVSLLPFVGVLALQCALATAFFEDHDEVLELTEESFPLPEDSVYIV